MNKILLGRYGSAASALNLEAEAGCSVGNHNSVGLRKCPSILIDSDTIKKITDDAARYAGKKERGGILLGLRRGPHLDVTDATLPTRWDRGSMFKFRRSARGHQDVAIRSWRESRQTVDWLGEWHSHPERVPSPSRVDIDGWRTITETRGAPMAFVIVGYESIWAGIFLPGRSYPIQYLEMERSLDASAFEPSNARNNRS